MNDSYLKRLSRRKFVAASVTALAGSAVFIADANSDVPQQNLTITQVIELIRQAIPLDVAKGTVDTIKSGNPEQPVTGIVTTMFATIDVIRKAIALKANLIIAHEPTFYNHLDETDWLQQHDIYKFKKELLEKNNIVIWRFHDFWHANKPDGVLMGVLTSLGWEKYYDAKHPRMLTIPAIKLQDLIGHLKKKLGIKTLRYIGDPAQVCSRVALMPGAAGGRGQMNVLHTNNPDVLICGELQEWETSEYVRDSRAMGINRSVIVLGHSVSEEPGMLWLVQWLKPKVPGITINHVPSNNPFTYV
jgi:putative NIF3 family GTP cyclohydrolase 1 type 2